MAYPMTPARDYEGEYKQLQELQWERLILPPDHIYVSPEERRPYYLIGQMKRQPMMVIMLEIVNWIAWKKQ